MPPSRAFVVGRTVFRALAAAAAAAARELAAERERQWTAEIAVADPAPADTLVGRTRGRQAVARCLYGSFVLAFVCLVLVVLNVDSLLPGDWRPFFRIGCGGVLILGGLPLAATSARGRSLVAAQLLRPRRERPAWQMRRGRGRSSRLLDLLLHGAGVAMLGAAAFELARAIPELV